MTDKETERRRQLSFIVEKLALITNKPSSKLYGVAGNLTKIYSVNFILEKLEQIPAGFDLAYCIGALRREHNRNTDFALMQNLTDGFVD